LAVFRLGEGGREGPGLAFAGFNGFLTQRQGPLDFEVRYKSGIFWLAFRETYPQMVFNASRPCEKLAMSW
jgi:hypothetical protein